MTAHLLGQILLAAMFGVSACMIADDIARNWRKIVSAWLGNASACRTTPRERAKPSFPRLHPTTKTGERM